MLVLEKEQVMPIEELPKLYGYNKNNKNADVEKWLKETEEINISSEAITKPWKDKGDNESSLEEKEEFAHNDESSDEADMENSKPCFGSYDMVTHTGNSMYFLQRKQLIMVEEKGEVVSNYKQNPGSKQRMFQQLQVHMHIEHSDGVKTKDTVQQQHDMNRYLQSDVTTPHEFKAAEEDKMTAN